MTTRNIDLSNLACGGVFIGVGLFFIAGSFDLGLGGPLRMGPGYFPALLASVLIIIGLVVGFGAFRGAGEPSAGPIALRGLVFVLPAPILFGLTVRGLGLVPALFLCAFLASFAAGSMRLRTALLLAVALTAFSTLVFSHALGLPYALLGSWLTRF